MSMVDLATKQKSLSSDDAFQLDVEIKQLRRGTIMDFWKMVHKLGKQREYRGWAVLGYESWESYLAQPEISYEPNTVNRFIECYVSIYKHIKNTPDKRTFDIVQLDPILLNFDATRAKLLVPRISNELLDKAEHLSYSDFIKEIEELKPKPEPLKPIEGKYQVIVIDPPWRYGTEYDAETRRVASPYPELATWIKDKTPEDKSSLEEFELFSDDNSIIWLWTTHKFLPDAFELLKIWGFEYKLTFVWDKQKMGMGAWLRCQVEFCLLGIKGKPQWNLTNERDILSIPRREHSRKPDEFYKMVENLTPGMNRIDIFSREKRPGWEVYGNETNKF